MPTTPELAKSSTPPLAGQAPAFPGHVEASPFLAAEQEILVQAPTPKIKKDKVANSVKNGSSAHSPEEQNAVAAAGCSAEIHRILDILTAQDVGNNGNAGAGYVRIRGCQVSSDRAQLQALQNLLGWTIGGFNTRPVEGTREQKERDRLEVLLSYRQPEDPGDPPEVMMYDYLCDTLFNVPMRPVGGEVRLPEFLDLDNVVRKAEWIETDWDTFKMAGSTRPPPVFRANRYPYQLPEVLTDQKFHEYHRRAQHWILWYFHAPWEKMPDASEEEVDRDLHEALRAVVWKAGFDRVDYIWYRNPAMSVPAMFHVQVFWIVPT